MGKVILGMAGPWAKNYCEASDHYTCKIGGLPDWPFPLPNEDLLECRSCGKDLCLLAQVYAPLSTLDFKNEERSIYVFGCVMPGCGTNPLSWRAICVQNLRNRDVVPDTNTCQEAVPSDAISKNDWWDELDGDDDDDDFDLEELGRELSEAATSVASISKQQTSHGPSPSSIKPSSLKEIKNRADVNKPVVPCFYIYTLEEPSSTARNFVCSIFSSLSIKEKQIDDDDQDQDLEDKWDKEGEGYEYDTALDADRTYLKFQKKIDAHPEQCFRYSYGGKPLLATSVVGDPGKCTFCGEPRQFEMQLMPPLLYFIQESADDDCKHLLQNWDWMTLLVYTCSKSCSPSLDDEMSNDGWVVSEEAVMLQLELPSSVRTI